MPVLPLAPASHLLFDDTYDHLPCLCPGLSPWPGNCFVGCSCPVFTCLCSDLDHLPDSSAVLQGPGPATSLAS